MFQKGIFGSVSTFLSKYAPNRQKTDFQYALNAAEKNQLRQSEDKPTVVALYDEHNGATNANLTIEHFEDKGLNVVKVAPIEGLNHPVFKGKTINGIYLPGGSDIPIHDDNDPRKKFEGQLTELASTKDVPLLGICRGEQAIGYHNHSDIQDLPDFDKHYSYEAVNNSDNPNLNTKVVVEQGSQIYDALQHKLGNQDKSSPIEYQSTCLHHQHIKDVPHNDSVKITGRNPSDQTIESIERKTGKYYTFGVQHHPEITINSYKQQRQERISHLQKEADEARFTANFFDPEVAVFNEFKYAQAIQKVHQKSKDEKAARAELGFFTSQVRKNFLEHQKAPLKTEMNSTDYILFDPLIP